MAYTLRPSEAEVDVEVRHEDQMKINEFGVLNQEKRELEDAIKDLKEVVDKYEIAEEQLDEATLLADDDEKVAKILVGDSFIGVENDEANDFIAKLKARDVAKLEALEARMDAMGKRLTVLKETLYGRFGKAINLEE